MRLARPRRTRPGLTLLEVLAALAIVSIAAVGWAGLMRQGIHAVEAAQARDSEVQRAAALLDRVSVWSGATMSASVGRARERGFMLTIAEVAPQFYEVAVADTSTGRILLRTSFYRGGSGRDSSATDGH